MNNKQQAILSIIWSSGGFAFGGTARALIRGDEPNDLDIRLGCATDTEAIKVLGAHVENDRAADHGEAYYDKQIVFDDGTKVHIKYESCSVTDCDINLIKLFHNKIELLYIPQHLKLYNNPILAVLHNIHAKQFIPLIECEEHRKYRWKEFEDRGWKKLDI